jgi:hypothetical protein
MESNDLQDNTRMLDPHGDEFIVSLGGSGACTSNYYTCCTRGYDAYLTPSLRSELLIHRICHRMTIFREQMIYRQRCLCEAKLRTSDTNVVPPEHIQSHACHLSTWASQRACRIGMRDAMVASMIQHTSHPKSSLVFMEQSNTSDLPVAALSVIPHSPSPYLSDSSDIIHSNHHHSNTSILNPSMGTYTETPRTNLSPPSLPFFNSSFFMTFPSTSVDECKHGESGSLLQNRIGVESDRQHCQGDEAGSLPGLSYMSLLLQ